MSPPACAGNTRLSWRHRVPRLGRSPGGRRSCVRSQRSRGPTAGTGGRSHGSRTWTCACGAGHGMTHVTSPMANTGRWHTGTMGFGVRILLGGHHHPSASPKPVPAPCPAACKRQHRSVCKNRPGIASPGVGMPTEGNTAPPLLIRRPRNRSEMPSGALLTGSSTQFSPSAGISRSGRLGPRRCSS